MSSIIESSNTEIKFPIAEVRSRESLGNIIYSKSSVYYGNDSNPLNNV